MTETPAKGVITITHTRAEGTILTGSRKGDGIFEIVRGHNFWFSRNVDGLFLKRSRDREAQTWRINAAAEALRAAGHEVTVEIDEDTRRSFAEAEADREERAAERAERYSDRAGRAVASADAKRAAADQLSKRFEFGQPILVGHHSEGRARRDAARIDANMRASFEDRDRGGYWSNRAKASESYTQHRKDPYRTLRRLEKLRADRRAQERHLAAATAAGRDGARHARLIEEMTEEIAHWEGVVEEAKAEGVKVWTPDDFTPGDFVRMRGSWYEVIRVNPKTLSIAWNLRLAPKPVMTREDATPPGYRLGTFTIDYTNVRGRCPGEVMRAYLADGKVPGTKTAHEASEKLPASAVRAAEAAKPKAKKRSDPKIPKRVRVECAQDRTTATLTFLTGRSQPHKDFAPVTLTPPEGEKFSEVMWANTLRAAAVEYLAGRGFRLRDAGWSGESIQGASRAIEEIPAAEPEPEPEPAPAPEPAPEAAEDEKQSEQAPAAEGRPSPAETCPMCHSDEWNPQARVCGHCHHNPTAAPAPAPAPAADAQDWQEAMAMVFIVSKNTRRARKRALWAMTRREAQAVCSDSRTSGRSYMLTWSDRPGDEGTDWEWVPDNGSLDAVLADLGITPRREWTTARDAVAAATA
ncbi:DUF3560 domain-containing protein [Streptomyces sp. VN1]|uniref:DUF3560 domain-containing protein n=1 Tax=Streptomyces sp. VN1 TaxID=1821625 RepID=UPI001413D25F|nr:DUF3560 domain-containing protein [Streptomyces sp. VN1]QIP74680.1 DUF3560 domain-containing protein [Streptomyces sp. VN1]